MHTLSPVNKDRILTWVLPWATPLLATGISWALSPILPKANFAMIYLAGVMLTAIQTRVEPALICALISFLSYNFFHTEPHFTLFMVHQEDVVTVTLLILTAAVTGQLAARLREKVTALEESNWWNHQQVLFAQELSTGMRAVEVVRILADQITNCFGYPAYGFYRQKNTDPLESLDGMPQEAGLEIPGCLDELANPLTINQDKLKAVILFRNEDHVSGGVTVHFPEPISHVERIRLESFTHLANLAWSRTQIEESLRQETTEKEREQLRSALLSSISHDLRSPLSTMIGSISSLIELHEALDRNQREELLTNTLQEAQRLDRYIQKLLDMTRLGHGKLTLDRDWIGLDDILSVVIKRGRLLTTKVSLEVSVPDDLPLLHVHPALIEQAIFNVLENAIRYAPSHSTVHIEAHQSEAKLHIDVTDSGVGLPKEEWKSIFDMFYTFSRGDQYAAGTGLGLAICQGILGAHGGSVSVLRSGPTIGTTIRLSIPLLPREPEETTS